MRPPLRHWYRRFDFAVGRMDGRQCHRKFSIHAKINFESNNAESCILHAPFDRNDLLREPFNKMIDENHLTFRQLRSFLFLFSTSRNLLPKKMFSHHSSRCRVDRVSDKAMATGNRIDLGYNRYFVCITCRPALGRTNTQNGDTFYRFRRRRQQKDIYKDFRWEPPVAFHFE